MARSFRLERQPSPKLGLRPSLARRIGGRGTGDRRERGATLVEYALLVSLFVLPTVTAINFVRDASKAKVETTVDGISHRNAPIGD